MNIESFEIFRAEALAAGFDEAMVREWAPHEIVPMHTHPFDANAVVTAGEMWLTCQGDTRHLTRGATFDLPCGTPHSERYGPEGAVYWVARRNR
jgi:quercetin dioxygenase-like cupin family protein